MFAHSFAVCAYVTQLLRRRRRRPYCSHVRLAAGHRFQALILGPTAAARSAPCDLWPAACAQSAAPGATGANLAARYLFKHLSFAAPPPLRKFNCAAQ